MTELMIQKLEEKGFKRWQKGNFDRLYINAKSLGLECDYYKTGNVSSAWLNGEKISNCQAKKMLCSKTYIDVKTGKLVSDHNWLEEEAKKIMEEVENAD